MLETPKVFDPADEIHIWTFATAGAGGILARFEPVLSPDEIERASRFHFKRLRDAFILTRGILRYLLGQYSGVDPGRIYFDYGPKGKPTLAGDANLQFNVSHSGDMAAIGFARGCPIGVDIERTRLVPDMQQIISQYFCAEETAEILSAPEAVQQRMFFCGWTRKEAYLKAIGDGLSAPLDSVRVTLQPDVPLRFIHIGHDMAVAEHWTLSSFPIAAGYESAVAYADRERHVSVFPIADVGEFSRI